MVLGHLLYISKAMQPMDRAQLEAIRKISSVRNRELDITGVLFYSAGHFVQLLEGDMDHIHRRFERIADDTRHNDVRLLVLRPSEKRVFAKWEMGLLDLDAHNDARQRDLEELIKLAESANNDVYSTPVELEILRRFRGMLTPA